MASLGGRMAADVAFLAAASFACWWASLDATRRASLTRLSRARDANDTHLTWARQSGLLPVSDEVKAPVVEFADATRAANASMTSRAANAASNEENRSHACGHVRVREGDDKGNVLEGATGTGESDREREVPFVTSSSGAMLDKWAELAPRLMGLSSGEADGRKEDEDEE